MGLEFEPLSPHHRREEFSCGEDSLDKYLKTQARKDMERGYASCYVLHEHDDPSIVGYYTLTSSQVELKALPEAITKKLPRYPQVPAVLLGRLAVSTTHQKQGLGRILLVDAVKRSLGSPVAAHLMVVDALHEEAARFYARHGFQSFLDPPLRLFLQMAQARTLFEQPPSRG